MAIFVAVALAAVWAPSAFAQAGAGENKEATLARTALPNDLGIELLGRSLIYSFSYQRMVTPLIGLEVAVSGLGSGATSGEASETLLFGGAGGRLYFMHKDASPFATAGVMLISASTDAGPFGSDHSTANYGYTGLGFEFRSRAGLLFRGTAYGLMANGGYFIWPGLTVGYAF
jgi:hypothetical protein